MEKTQENNKTGSSKKSILHLSEQQLLVIGLLLSAQLHVGRISHNGIKGKRSPCFPFSSKL